MKLFSLNKLNSAKLLGRVLHCLFRYKSQHWAGSLSGMRIIVLWVHHPFIHPLQVP
jgi:hypothetical protein